MAKLRIQRRDTLRLLQDNPSLTPYLEKAVQEAYENAKDLAMAETNGPTQIFPSSCLYSLTEILNDQYYPGEFSSLLE